MPPRLTPALIAALAAATAALAQDTDPELHSGVLLPQVNEPLVRADLDSGTVRADTRRGNGYQEVFDGVVKIDGALSVRLVFDDTVLAGAPGSGTESYLLITSLFDGHQQYLNAQHLRQWRDTSAYFNGESVRVQLFAAPGTGDNRVAVNSAMVALPHMVDRSICGSADDRALSSDPRAGRIWDIGCTAWLFNGRNNCLLTAGHCGPASSDVIEFNVPLSNGSGTPQHPGPDDQYAIDPASIQTNGGLGVGNDWAYFGVFDNSTTGLSPLEAAGGASYTLAATAPPGTGRSIRVTGFGSTSSPVSPTWYLVQKTHVGPYAGVTGTNIRYTTDTTGGNSGSAVEDESTGLTIGIHTHAGCTSGGGANNGTAIQHAALQAALANPQGVCRAGLNLGFLGQRPAQLDPDGGSPVAVTILPDEGVALDPASVTLHVDTGSGYAAYPMSDAGASFLGTFPPIDCGTVTRFYVSAADTGGTVYTLPAGAPAQRFTAFAADDMTTFASHDFETSAGWSVTNTALTSGAWVVGVPGNFNRDDPPADYDGSGRCWVTGNALSQDVDGGPTVLTSVDYDLSGANEPLLSYARWHRTNETNGADDLRVEISNDAGASWTLVEVVPDTENWVEVQVRVSDYVEPSSNVRVRFSVSDNPNASVTESAIDAFSIVDMACDAACSPADFDADGTLSLDDVEAFVAAFAQAGPDADLTGDGEINLDDLEAFVAAFQAGCP